MAKKQLNYIVYSKEKISPQSFIDFWQPKLNESDKKKITIEEFMDIANEVNGLTNLEIIWSSYDDFEKETYKSEYESKNLPYIKPGWSLSFPSDGTNVLLEQIFQDKQYLVQEDFPSYWSDNMTKLLADEDYVPDNVVAYDEEFNVNTKVQPVNIRVWIYCKSIDSVIDVSQFIMNCNINKSFKTGDFSFTLVPFRDAKKENVFGASYQDVFNVVTKEGNDVKSYLEKVVQANDIVFIRFERLKLEGESDSEDANTIFVSPNKLAETDGSYNVWDMIGFIDESSTQYSSEDNAKTTTVSGRDISKLFEEDGSYFIPLIDVENTNQHWVYLGRPQDSWYKRNVLTGSYNYIWSYKYKRINEIIWFVINIMSNIGVCKNELFKSWKDKRIQSYQVEGLETAKVNGIWQIVKTYMSPEVQQRIVVDSSIGNPNGTLMDYMSRCCQYPFVEFFFDTYINTIDLIVRQPPFTEHAIMDAFEKGSYITITPDNVLSYNLSYDSRIYSWFQIHVQNNNILGDKQQVNLAFVPIVYLNEYAELWGNRKLEINDMYAQMRVINGYEGPEQFVTMQAALLNDLIYVVESNAYLPFTRTGTIVINGDRRIKVGSFILNESTNEFFYVLSVSNEVSFTEGGIDRRTTIQVERGMYVPILKGSSTLGTSKRQDNSQVGASNASVNEAISPTGGSFKPSYFKLVDLKDLRQAAKSAQQGNLTTATSPIVDKSQFEYFLNRKMYGGLK